MSELVSVVLPTMNRKKDLIECIESIKLSTHKNIEVIISDNGSTDGSVEAVKENFPDVTIIENKRNLGSPIAINKCLLVARGEYILRLDDDVVIENNTIEEMLKILKSDEKIGAVSALCFYKENPKIIRAAGITIGKFFGRTKVYGKDESDISPYEGNIEREAAGGGTMLAKKDAYERAGFYNESYFLSYEDVHWCWRLRREGYKIIVTSSTRLYHKKDKISKLENPFKVYLSNRGQVLFMKKTAGKRNLVFIPYLLFVSYPLKLISFLLKGHFKSTIALTKGIWDALFNEKVFVYEDGKQVPYGRNT